MNAMFSESQIARHIIAELYGGFHQLWSSLRLICQSKLVRIFWILFGSKITYFSTNDHFQGLFNNAYCFDQKIWNWFHQSALCKFAISSLTSWQLSFSYILLKLTCTTNDYTHSSVTLLKCDNRYLCSMLSIYKGGLDTRVSPQNIFFRLCEVINWHGGLPQSHNKHAKFHRDL